MSALGGSRKNIKPAAQNHEQAEMQQELNAELHARPSIYFSGPALVEHIALMPVNGETLEQENLDLVEQLDEKVTIRTQLEFHTEFVTVTRVTPLDVSPPHWPIGNLSLNEARSLSKLKNAELVYRSSILVLNGIPRELGVVLKQFDFADTAASSVGAGSAQVCSDFRTHLNFGSRLLFFNEQLNSYRLGRMVRRLYEIETYRAMALRSLPIARRLAPLLSRYDKGIAEVATRNVDALPENHKALLDQITALSAKIVSASADTRTRFGATIAYAKIVEERILELREGHIAGFQRFGVFVTRRFRPAIRSCEATALRLEQMSHATMHLIDLLQTKIQVEVELQNLVQIKEMSERTAAQVKIQRAVEGLSIIAISYYFLSLLKLAMEALDYAGFHIWPSIKLMAIPITIAAVVLSISKVRKAISK
ncbi:DUF3422 domain-containing protein [Ochrobactrum chromiisoli]|uniref:DUF3422 domain-containing protein n=1 Tax=Ochrobactrum chromiisoli TaxID=2993941 RepID=A0ABT3QSH8_9HYPH|nr:DUF3422 domain-containing protein [Ochrobactrum chromiisoli]MCX2698573.1 DUF3422 domain-containing protein [Ochrobactrum chromiisoli]